MKVLIVTNMELFIWGGAEELATNLAANIRQRGHEVDLLRIPFFYSDPSKLIGQMLLVKNIELYNVDKVIALKFPAYLINHPNKSIWLIHQFRQAYDLNQAGESYFDQVESGEVILQAIRKADNQSLSQVKKIYTNSVTVSARLKQFNNLDSQPLLPPINNTELFSNISDEGYLFAGGRINSMKRQSLIIEAAALTSKTVKIIIAGPADSEKDAKKLLQLIKKNQLEDRVILDIGFHSRSKIAEYVGRCSAAIYIPIDEDSYGYVAGEAAISEKPLITCTDSGGILEIVKDGITGWISPPTAFSLARSFENALSNPEISTKFGAANKQNFESLGITWDNIIMKLLS